MKQPFRYFRGEFRNSKYLYDLIICPNFTVQDVLDEMVYQSLFQWKLENETVFGEMAIRYKDIINIAKVAGLFQTWGYGRDSLGSIYFTESHIAGGQERSERGLLDMEQEIFKFVRTELDSYDDDIVNEASENMRMSLVPEGAEPAGFLPCDRQLYSEDGKVIWENLLPVPPDDGTPYTTYYGEKYLVHEEFFRRETLLPVEILKLLLECVQRIRYNGPSIIDFMEITKILCGKMVYDIEIESQNEYYVVYFSVDGLAIITHRERRFAVWLGVCRQKFKLFVLKNRG